MRAALFLFAALTWQAAPQDELTFRAGVSLVRVDAEVADSSGNTLTGLTKSDFRLLDQGVEQSIVNFSFEKDPLDLILLFDTGNAMRSRFHQVLRAVELGFHELQPGDRVCVMAFGSTSVELAPFTSDLDAVNASVAVKIPGLKLGGAPDIAGAATEAAMRFRKERVTARRRAVLLISDRTSRGAGVQPAIRALWQSDAVLGELIIGKLSGDDPIASQTGGATIGASIGANGPGEAFQNSVRTLRRRYTLHYALPQGAVPGTERKIELHVMTGRATVRARTGYVVKAAE